MELENVIYRHFTKKMQNSDRSVYDLFKWKKGLLIHKPSESKEKHYEAKDFIYGEICPNCKSTKMVKNGTCKVCTECESTTGCS